MPFRVTQNIINNVVIQNLNRNLYSLLKIQSKLSSGKRLTRPSDDPIGTATAIRLRTRLSETQQFLRNMDSGETQLNQTDTVFDDMSSLLMRAQELAINQANVTADYRTREAVAQEVNALISQFVDLLNTRIGNRYIFGGFETLQTPFLESANGLKYTGDSGITNIEIESGSLLNTSVPGSLLLPTAVDELGGHANLHPYAERSIPLAQRKLTECNLGTGVDDGFIQITTAGGKTANIDLTGIENLGEVVFRLNSALDTQGARLKISARLDEEREAFIIEDLTPNADRLPDQKLTVKELSNGRVARQLGILGEDRTGSGSITGRNLSLLKLTTRLQDLNRGSGVELGKFQITDRSGNSAVVDISGAQTLVDVRELINAAGTNLHAYINTGGNGIMIVDESPLSAKGNIKITEYGENTHTARDLGILTTETGAEGRIFTGETLDPILSYDTPVVLLNRGQGFDLKTIRVENGPETGVIDLSKASTIGGIIQTINESGLDIKAEINDLGTGISIVSLVGGRTLRITNEPRSYTASLLGIEGQRDTPVDPVTPLGTHSNLMPALTGETRLGDLNGGQGVAPGLIRITDMMGSAITININGVNTVQGVINRINEAGAQGKGLVNVVASLSPDQKSITITDLSIQNTIINKVTSTGSLTAAFNDISVGDAVAINTLQTGSGKYIARNLDLVSKPLDTEISIIGDIESVDKEKGEIALRAENGTLYRVLSQQPVDNLFIGQSIYLNGNILPTGEFQARTVDLVSDPESGDEQIAGIIESVDTENKTVNLLLGDGSRRQIEIVTQRGLIKVEDLAGGTTASDLGIQGVSTVGSNSIQGSALDPIISYNTELRLLNGGTFTPGKIRISNGDKDEVIDLSNAKTIGDMLTLINASSAEVVASINSSGTGISLRSRTSGTTMMVNKIALQNPDGSNKVHSDGTTIFDETADNLGLTGSADVVGNLIFLREALHNNNQQDISLTLDKFSEALNRILNQRTKIGAYTNQLTTTNDRGVSTNLRNTEILSGIEDLDVVEAVSELAAQENAFNAALGAASRIILPSLLDFL